MLSEFIAEVRTLLEQMHVGVRLIACDAKVQLDIVLEPGDPIPLDIGGGGGTRFGPVFELLAKDASPPPVLVYYTDGWGSFPDEHWPWRTLWVVTPDHAEPPFGERALFEPMNWRNREDL
jgi:predicted metal-dependent peptidase